MAGCPAQGAAQLDNGPRRATEHEHTGGRPARPGEGEIVGRGEDGAPVPRYAGDEPLSGTTGDIEAMALYAGQSCGVISGIPPAGTLVTDLWGKVPEALERAATASEPTTTSPSHRKAGPAL
ncbi:MAG: hypothetical protein ACRDZ5_09465 [Acidimicrobiales bacterium]